jgi:nucleoside-diphosphate-sugar epimerase
VTQLLVLGGTSFVGPALVDAAVARGWDVTTFSRHPERGDARVRTTRGDRLSARTLSVVADRDWDLVVDTWAGDPSAVHASLAALAGRFKVYAYVSSISVYAEPLEAGFDETARVVDVPGAETDYAVNKRAAEVAVLDAAGPDGALIPRPGAIVGPRENTRRLLYWLRRAADTERFLAPPPTTPLQWVDARDLARFTLDSLVSGVRGIFNLACPPGQLTFASMIEACVSVTGKGAEPVWADDSWLQANGVRPWLDLPLWLPAGDPDAAVLTADSSRALASGYSPRSPIETVRDTWRWLREERGAPDAGLARQRERQLLEQVLDEPAT